MKTAKDVLKHMKDNDVKYVDLRFTDPRGKWQHVTFDVGHDRRRHLLRRLDVRRLLDCRLEGDQRIRHVPDARSGHRDHRSLLRRDHLGPGLRRAGADHRRALQPRSPRHRQEGGSHGEVDGRRRHRVFRTRGRVLRVRRRALLGAALQHRLQARLRGISDQLRHRIRGRQSRSPHPHQGRLLPGAAAGLRCRTCARRCSARWPRWASRSRSITTRSPPPSTSSA